MAAVTPAPDRWLVVDQDATGTSYDQQASPWSDCDEEPDLPAVLGGVRILREIGRGGMGRVYLGYHQILDIQVAIKVMLDHRNDRERFLNEVRLAARVDSAHLVRVLHAGDEADILFLVMEYVPGLTLRQLVQEQGPLPWADAARHILQAARGLAAVHRHGIIHCDVKPANMLLDPSGTVKVSDLGLARTILGSTQGNDRVVGTPAFMAPEQALEPHCITTSADVYSLGASLYYLISGEYPVRVRDVSDIREAHRASPNPDLRHHVPGVPDPLARLVRRMLAKDPGLRPLDASVVVTELEQMLGIATVSTSVRSTQPTIAPAITHRRRFWSMGVGGAVLAGAALLGLRSPVPPTPRPTAAAILPAQAAPSIVAAQEVVDSWRTPPRAAFVLAEHLSAAARAAIDDACRASRLPLVERERIDALVHEQDMLTAGRIDPSTAGRIAHLCGGHLALIATGIDDRIELRTVLVETGEIADCRLVAMADIGTAVTNGIIAATTLLPLRARIKGDQPTLDAGYRHGLHVGDHLELRRAPDASAFASAVVRTIERDQATLEVTPAGTDPRGAYAVRQGP